MKILFLDDDPNRHTIFELRMKNQGHEVTYVFDAQAAIKELRAQPFELVLLDHDLGGEASQNRLCDDDEDGRFVVRWLVANSQLFKETTFVVHSLNFDGRQQMVAMLRNADLKVIDLPFAWSKFRFNV